MKDYDILIYIRNYRDEKGERAFRPSKDYQSYTTSDGKTITIPCSFYREVRLLDDGTKESIEIRAADHGTILKLWSNYRNPEPWKNRYNLDIEFLNDPKPQNNLDGNTDFFVVDQWIYDNATITPDDLDKILSTIITLGENDYKDPTGKVVRHIALQSTDKDGNDISDRSNVHPHQLEVLKNYEKEKEERENKNKQDKDMKTENRKRNVVRLNESQLKQMISESVRKVLMENDYISDEDWERLTMSDAEREEEYYRRRDEWIQNTLKAACDELLHTFYNNGATLELCDYFLKYISSRIRLMAIDHPNGPLAFNGAS